MSDQAALPNLNANWVNAKGMSHLGITRAYTNDFPRCLDNPFCSDSGSEDIL
jgi:hypothetical protein